MTFGVGHDDWEWLFYFFYFVVKHDETLSINVDLFPDSSSACQVGLRKSFADTTSMRHVARTTGSKRIKGNYANHDSRFAPLLVFSPKASRGRHQGLGHLIVHLGVGCIDMVTHEPARVHVPEEVEPHAIKVSNVLGRGQDNIGND